MPSFTTVLNTFGGTWWSANDGRHRSARRRSTSPSSRRRCEFYVDLINDAGEDDAANASFNECLAQYRDGKVAMWYDATVAAGLLEADDSPVKGLNGYAHGAGQGDRGVGLAVGVGAGHPADLARSGHGVGVHLVGDRSGVHRRRPAN